MKILLIYPRGKYEEVSPTLANHSEPLGLCYIGAQAKKQGHDVKSIQQIGQTNEDIVSFAEYYQPEVVGFSCMTYNFPNGLELARQIAQHTGTKIVFGGYHVTADPAAIREDAINYIVKGEGDRVFSQLLNALQQNARTSQLEKIKGLVYKDGSIINDTGMPVRITNLGVLPFPLRESLQVGGAFYTRQTLSYPAPSSQRRASISSSRGCKHNCSFCNSPRHWERNWIGRNPNNIVDEIEFLTEKYLINYLEFTDENFTEDRNRVIELCKEIKRRNMNISWYCQSRISDLLNPNGGADVELLSTIKNAGCFEIEYGIESGIEASLHNIGKGITLDRIRTVIEASKNEGLSVHALFMLGFPWEKRGDLEQTVNFAKELVADKYRFAFAVPFKGTSLYTGMDKGKIKDWDLSKWTSDFPIVELDDMSQQDLLDFRKQAYRDVYSNQEYLSRSRKRVKDCPELKQSYEEWFQFLDEKFSVKLEG